MLHYSAIIYWNTSERNNEPILKVHFYILDGEKLCCGLYNFDLIQEIYFLCWEIFKSTISEMWPKLRFFFGYTKELFFKISAQEPWKVCVK